MKKLEQFLKPPTNINAEEEMYNVSQERDEEVNENIDYNQNDENSYDNGNKEQNIENDENNEELQNSKNKNYQNFQNEEENSEIIQGINSLNNICSKNNNINDNENQNETGENNNNIKNFNQNFLNINDNNEFNDNVPIKTSPDEIMNDLLFKIRKFKGARAVQKNNITNTNELNINNEFKTFQRDIRNENLKINKNVYIGNLNMNNQIIQNNPKMKEIANLIKDYNQDKNNNDNIQLNFYKNNNQINILKPDVFFNMNNPKKQNNEEYNYDNSFNQNKHYISIIDGKAIINGQRININSNFNSTPKDNYLERRINFGDLNNYNNKKKSFFNFENERRNSFFDNKNNLDFKLQNIKKNIRFNNIENCKNNNRLYSRSNYFTKEFYKEELNKMNDNLFNLNNERFILRK